MALINAVGKLNKQQHSRAEFNIRKLVSYWQSPAPPKVHLASIFSHYNKPEKQLYLQIGKEKKKAAIHL